MKRLAYKFRLCPSAAQAVKMAQFAGCARFVFNKMLALEQAHYAETKQMLGYQQAAALLVQWKQTSETNFLKAAHSQILQQKLQDLYRAYINFFQHRAQLPKFKKKGFNDSFRYPQDYKLEEYNHRLFLPKIGWLRYRQSRLITGKIKNMTVSYQAGHWYVAIQTEQELPTVKHPSNSAVGIDVGIINFATCSDGTVILPINSAKRNAKKLAWLQRQLARKRKSSRNRQKCLQRLSKFSQHIANMRRDFLHKVTTNISKNHALVVLEDLAVCNMSKSAKGTLENPGKNVAAKAGLNKAILDQGWSELRRQLSYKLAWSGGQLLLVQPQYTSQTCSSCHYRAAENRKTQSSFVCGKCYHAENADINAAKNILAAGYAVLACGETAVRPSMKQEPTWGVS